MREKVGVKVVRALKRNNDGVSHAAIDMLCALMQVGCIDQSVYGFMLSCTVTVLSVRCD